MREAPSRSIIKELVRRGARVQAYDPVASKEALNCFEVDFKSNPQNLLQRQFGQTLLNIKIKVARLIGLVILKEVSFYLIV
jgi:UDPglucose 6-dehydrogenase